MNHAEHNKEMNESGYATTYFMIFGVNRGWDKYPAQLFDVRLYLHILL